MADTTPKEEERKSILGWLAAGLWSGTLFIVKWMVVVGLFILISQYPQESKEIALEVASRFGDAALWVVDWVLEVAEKARGHSNSH